jgi:hypothetical protein
MSSRRTDGARPGLGRGLLVVVAAVLVARDLGVLALDLGHEGRELLVLLLRDRFRLDTGRKTLGVSETTSDDGRSRACGPTFILTLISPPEALMTRSISTSAFSMRSTPPTLSVLLLLTTYSGGATSRILIGTAAVETASPARSAALMASMPSYEKHLTSMSDRILTAFGVSRRAMLSFSAWWTSSEMSSDSNTRSSSLQGGQESSQEKVTREEHRSACASAHKRIPPEGQPHLIDSLKAS